MSRITTTDKNVNICIVVAEKIYNKDKDAYFDIEKYKKDNDIKNAYLTAIIKELKINAFNDERIGVGKNERINLYSSRRYIEKWGLKPQVIMEGNKILEDLGFYPYK